jgi:hypothetical protein
MESVAVEKLRDSAKCCVSTDDDLEIITKVTKRHPSQGIYYKFPGIYHPCWQDKDPG